MLQRQEEAERIAVSWRESVQGTDPWGYGVGGGVELVEGKNLRSCRQNAGAMKTPDDSEGQKVKQLLIEKAFEIDKEFIL